MECRREQRANKADTPQLSIHAQFRQRRHLSSVLRAVANLYVTQK